MFQAEMAGHQPLIAVLVVGAEVEWLCLLVRRLPFLQEVFL